MKLAVIGKTGQLARALRSLAPEADYYGRDALDLSSSADEIKRFVSNLHCDALIIAAAYTAVDKAQEEPALAMAINGTAPTAIAQSCADNNIALVHVSTDYVFNGQATSPYKTTSKTNPIGVYGKTKLVGEQGLFVAKGRSVVVRTSWVFDGVGQNFFNTMLRLAETRDQLSVVADQFGRPTYAPHLASALLNMLPSVSAGQNKGIYHVSGTGPVISWADFARTIIEKTQNHRDHRITVKGIPTVDYPTPAARPAFSALDTSKYEHDFKALPSWEGGLEEAYKEWVKTKV